MGNKVTERLVNALLPGLDIAAENMRKLYDPFLGPNAPAPIKDGLYGVWLGHPLHPAVVLLPIGCWTSSLLLDAAGMEEAADLTLKVGTVSALAAAATGAAQWQDTQNLDHPRRVGTLHAILNTVAAGLYGASWVCRDKGARPAGIALSTTGFAIASFSAWLGGDLAYDLGIGVDRTAFERSLPNWTDVLAETDLPDKTPKRVTAADVPVLLYRHDGEVFAISATCTHLGGPLDEGEIDAASCTVTCPWHQSVFRLEDGSVVHGPASVPQAAYETRTQGGQIEIRLRR